MRAGMMRFALKLCAALLLVSPASAETVRFATLNAWWLFDDQPPHASWGGQRDDQSWEDALAHVADAVARIDADVLALQEVEDRQAVERLNAVLASRGKGYPHYWVGAGDDPFTGQDVAVLSRFPNLTEPVRSYPAMQEDFHTNNGYPRVAALHKFMRVDLEVEGEPVTVFALHLKSKRGNRITSDGERLAQARMVRRLVRPVLEKGQPKIVVMGDFNDIPGSPALREIRGLNDASWDLSNAAESERMDGEAWTYQYRGNKEQIDHVLLSKFLFDKVASASVVRIDSQASDHDAFAVDIAFSE
ncbi:MAG: endonuclease/exonuclease/phosphatase family protein, partial [Gammaproteobacteria bacterium]|nr:endonuclease/exonuclease/phosphatase family protein [Gammaproteobacteria bacterium]